MKGGKNKHLPLGYTIVEVLIVLAVSGMMFVIAANFINGKQQKTAFTQGVNEVASRIQDAIEQVSDGSYSDIPFSCTTSGSAPSLTLNISPSASSATQGTNPSCVYIGKFLHFNGGGSSSGYEVFSLAAARSSTTLGSDVTPVTGAVDLTLQQAIPQHLTLTNTGIQVAGRSGTYYGFGFVQSQGTAVSTDNFASGAQTVNLVYSPNLTVIGANESTAASILRGHIARADGVSMCLTDGKRFALLTIGSSGGASQLDVGVKMQGTNPC